jgi:hypothetical protein
MGNVLNPADIIAAEEPQAGTSEEHPAAINNSAATEEESKLLPSTALSLTVPPLQMSLKLPPPQPRIQRRRRRSRIPSICLILPFTISYLHTSYSPCQITPPTNRSMLKRYKKLQLLCSLRQVTSNQMCRVLTLMLFLVYLDRLTPNFCKQWHPTSKRHKRNPFVLSLFVKAAEVVMVTETVG